MFAGRLEPGPRTGALAGEWCRLPTSSVAHFIFFFPVSCLAGRKWRPCLWPQSYFPSHLSAPLDPTPCLTLLDVCGRSQKAGVGFKVTVKMSTGNADEGVGMVVAGGELPR